MSYTYYSYLGLIPDSTPVTLDEAYNRLVQAYENDTRHIHIGRERTRIVLDIEGWTFRIYLSDAAHIASESRELADEFAKGHPKQERIAGCKRRFETAADSDGNWKTDVHDPFLVEEKLLSEGNVKESKQ